MINVRSGRARLCGGDHRCCGGVQDVGDTKKKRNKVVVGDDEEAEVTDAALMINVEKCLARLRKSLSPATVANGMVRACPFVHLV